MVDADPRCRFQSHISTTTLGRPQPVGRPLHNTKYSMSVKRGRLPMLTQSEGVPIFRYEGRTTSAGTCFNDHNCHFAFRLAALA